MADNLVSRLKKAWNAFSNRDPTNYRDYGSGYFYSPYIRHRPNGNERSIVTSVFNRIALDVADIPIHHVQLDENGRYIGDKKSGLNTCLTLSANVDQTGYALMQDVAMSMLEDGVVAIVPVDTDTNPEDGSFDILSLRAGPIVAWYPNHVRVSLYNEELGRREEIVLPKRSVAIVESPLRNVINEPNSTMQRLIRKLNLLDIVDEQSGSGKLDMIIQLPYIIKTEARKRQAEERRKDIEMQLAGSKYGIAYTDGTERITQLNRPVENNLMKQVEYLTTLLYSQLGMTQAVLDGTADEKTMLNYYNRTIQPFLTAISSEMRRKFLTQTARTQGQSIEFYRNVFKLVGVSDIAEIADKLTRNEILSSNEVRQIIGLKPADDPNADALKNKNIADNSNTTELDAKNETNTAGLQINTLAEEGKNQNE